MYEARDITFAWSGRKILKGVGFKIPAGESVVIAGENGAGKTTLLKVLAGLAAPLSGSVFLDSRDTAVHPLRYRKLLGYLPETPVLYEDMTVREYLLYRAVLKGETSRRRIKRRIDEVIAECSLRDLAHERGDRLSAGQKKRVAFADAVLSKPRVLLLDDLYSGLDFAFRTSVRECISVLAPEASVVATGHEIEEFAAWVDRFLVLGDGTLAACVEKGDLSAEQYASAVRRALGGGGK